MLAKLGIPSKLKEIQRLAGCAAFLNRFISRLGEKALPLYRLLKKTDNFEGTTEASKVLEEIKTLLATNPILTTLHVGYPMLYISATNQVASVVLVVER